MAKQKFTDQQFLELYKKGLYDTEIAHILNINNTTATMRRWKLDLPTNYIIRTNTATNPKQHRKEIKTRKYYSTGKAYQQRIQQKLNKQQKQRHHKKHPNARYRARPSTMTPTARAQHYKKQKEDRIIYNKEYYTQNYEQIQKVADAYRQKNREKLRLKAIIYHQQHKNEINARARAKRKRKKNLATANLSESS